MDCNCFFSANYQAEDFRSIAFYFLYDVQQRGNPSFSINLLINASNLSHIQSYTNCALANFHYPFPNPQIPKIDHSCKIYEAFGRQYVQQPLTAAPPFLSVSRIQREMGGKLMTKSCKQRTIFHASRHYLKNNDPNVHLGI